MNFLRKEVYNMFQKRLNNGVNRLNNEVVSQLPTIHSYDNGKVLKVANGQWSVETINELPNVLGTSESLIPKVNNSGTWVSTPFGELSQYIDDNLDNHELTFSIPSSIGYFVIDLNIATNNAFGGIQLNINNQSYGTIFNVNSNDTRKIIIMQKVALNKLLLIIDGVPKDIITLPPQPRTFIFKGYMTDITSSNSILFHF